MTRARWLMAAGIVAVAGIFAGALWFGPWRSTGEDGISPSAPARRAAGDLAAAWTSGQLDAVAWAPASDRSAAEQIDPPSSIELLTHGLAAGALTPKVTVERVSLDPDETTARATMDVAWELTPGRTWAYETEVRLVSPSTLARIADADHASPGGGSSADAETDVARDERWLVVYDHTLVHPELTDGDLLRVHRELQRRGDIVDLTGRSLVAGRGSQVVVGFRPSRVGPGEDPGEVARTVAAHVGVDPDELARRVAAARPDDVVEVATLTQDDYREVRPQIHPIPGTVFETKSDGSDLPEGFARAVLGSVGPASAEVAAASGGRVAEGDLVGSSGVQLGQDLVLGGQPDLVVQAVRLDPNGVALPDTARVLHEFPGEPGNDVAVTLDVDLQLAADAAVATTAQPSALVAIRPSTGEVLAVANGPTNYSGYNRAMIGSYPPGSVFKVVTTLALLESGLTPDTAVDCPETFVAGKSFRNAGGIALGTVPFRVNFARSCNTAFVSRHGDIDTEQLIGAADRLGYRRLEMGLPTYGGSIPPAEDLAEHASDMIGQGKVLASPLAVALSSASVASGRSLVPRLVVDPSVPHPEGDPLPAEVAAELQSLMRSVVTDGTGSALADVLGGPVHGKTGTAEYGIERPPLTHAWFTGYQGDLAFAVLVENSSGGGAVAAPVAARFLELVAAGS